MKRLWQLITGVHRIHDIRWSYGWKLPFVGVARFDRYGWKRTTKFHDCTRTGRY